MEKQAIQKALDSNLGQVLKEYLLERFEQFKNIENVEKKETLRLQSVQDEAHRLTCKWLREVLTELIDMGQESKEKDPRDDFSVGM